MAGPETAEPAKISQQAILAPAAAPLQRMASGARRAGRTVKRNEVLKPAAATKGGADASVGAVMATAKEGPTPSRHEHGQLRQLSKRLEAMGHGHSSRERPMKVAIT